jgi:hypothetical protein
MTHPEYRTLGKFSGDVSPLATRSEELKAAYQRIDELEVDLTQWVRQAEDISGNAQRCFLRAVQLEKALRVCVDYLDRSDKWMDRHGSAITQARKLLGPEIV